jgi:hypothetical protein
MRQPPAGGCGAALVDEGREREAVEGFGDAVRFAGAAAMWSGRIRASGASVVRRERAAGE